MDNKNKIYIAIDLKSFYASVECVERGLDPLSAHLVVADSSRTEKTICLAVTPALKAYGIPGRARLFEVVQRVKELNIENPKLNLTYITAPPRMGLYMQYSTKIYDIYLRYVSKEDMHIYSVDEVFIDATAYLHTYNMTPRQLAMTMIKDVLKETGITATAGIGTNMYLCKIAMDIVAKHLPADTDGVRIAQLDEMSYRRFLWGHKPITDFWRVGHGIAKKLASYGMYTMGDVARCSIGKDDDFYNEELLYKLFGVNAELLIDHSWGWEPATIKDIRSYVPSSNSLSSGQVLHCAYTAQKAKLIVREMTDLLILDLVEKQLITPQMVLTIGYDIDNLSDPEIAKKYHGEVVADRYGRLVPKHAHGSVNLPYATSSTRLITDAVMDLYDRIINPDLLVRRVTIAACELLPESAAVLPADQSLGQLDFFTDYDALEKQRQKEKEDIEKERRAQHAVLDLKKKFGKNAVLKGMNLEEGAMTISRNNQIGGHKA